MPFILTPGWLKKASKLRATVACIPDGEIKDLSPSMSDMIDAMRAYRRGTITEDEAFRRCTAAELAGRAEPHIERLHEPADIYGWQIKATLVRWHDKVCWLVVVDRPSRTCTGKDLAMLGKVMVALGSDDPKRDQVSVGGDPDELARRGSPIIFAWPNTDQLLDVHVNKEKRGKDLMRIVPRGSRPTDGYENLDDLAAAGDSAGADERS